MKLLRLVFKYSKVALISTIIIGIISGVCGAAIIAVLNMAMRQDKPLFSWQVVIFVVLLLLLPVTRTLSELFLVKLGQETVFVLRKELTAKVLSVSLQRIEDIGAPRILAALTEDIANIANFINTIPLLCINIALVISCLCYLAFLSPLLFAGMIVVMIVGVASYRALVNRAINSLRAARKEQDSLYKSYDSLVTGTKELKIHRERRKAFLADLTETAAKVKELNTTGLNLYSFASNWGQSLLILTVGALAVGGNYINSHGNPIVIEFVVTLFFLAGPLQMILNSMPMLNRSSISIGNVEGLGLSLVDSAGEYREAPAPASDSSLQCLELVGATYTYLDERERRFTLGPIDLRFQPGEVVFLIGGNGSGKTTLAKLLAGLYHPISGELRWNGAKIIDNDLDDYRQHISAVFSEPHVFEKLLGIDGADLDDRAAQYLDEFQLRETVAVKNGKFSTVNLSRGQRKRLALLTAFLENREVYLFDEWAADQDPTFKEIFYRRTLADLKARRKAVIVISHDDHYYSMGDRIIKLDLGRIVADSSARHYHRIGVNE